MADVKNMAMNPNGSKHIRSFWPLVIIIVITLILGGLIWYFAESNVVQDDINSSTFAPLGFLKKKPVVKKPVHGKVVPKAVTIAK